MGNIDKFIISLEVMGKGMLSIFAVIIVLTLIVMLLGKLPSGKKKKQDDEA